MIQCYSGNYGCSSYCSFWQLQYLSLVPVLVDGMECTTGAYYIYPEMKPDIFYHTFLNIKNFWRNMDNANTTGKWYTNTYGL